jgi:hypothetical protein
VRSVVFDLVDPCLGTCRYRLSSPRNAIICAMIRGLDGVVGMRRVTQAVLPLLPAAAVPIGPLAGLVIGPEGGVVFVAGMATFAFDAGDEVGRRPAAVQLVATRIASAVAVAEGFDVSVETLWRWRRSFDTHGVVVGVAARSARRGRHPVPPGGSGPAARAGPRLIVRRAWLIWPIEYGPRAGRQPGREGLRL